MFKKVTPEEAGISSKNVLKYLKVLESYGFSTHSVLMARGNDIFLEMYYKPFDKDFKHRMYSVSKSFVSIAVGLAVEDGLLSLDDKFIDFFPEFDNENTDDLLKEATISEMLKMQTAVHSQINWFDVVDDDRLKIYFDNNTDKISGTVFDYDTSSTYMLGVIVEKLTDKPFLEYLKEKFLLKIGFSEDAYCIKTPGGYSFGDSGIMCTSMDLLIFARFVMNKGVWDGVRYMNKEYLDTATSNLVSTNNAGHTTYSSNGYGYQIWQAPKGGFMFLGMGDQIAICNYEKDLIFVITSDNQGSQTSRPIIYHEFYNTIVDNMDTPISEDKEAYKALTEYTENAELTYFKEDYDNPFIEEINGVTYKLDENPMKIEYVKFEFFGKKGSLKYKNEQGEKKLDFGIGYNEFGYFPETGYSDLVAMEFAPGNKYKCACSAKWEKQNHLHIKVQIIDKYFGNACFVFAFKDDKITVLMTKTAEAFLDEYNGIAIGKKA